MKGTVPNTPKSQVIRDWYLFLSLFFPFVVFFLRVSLPNDQIAHKHLSIALFGLNSSFNTNRRREPTYVPIRKLCNLLWLWSDIPYRNGQSLHQSCKSLFLSLQFCHWIYLQAFCLVKILSLTLNLISLFCFVFFFGGKNPWFILTYKLNNTLFSKKMWEKEDYLKKPR